MAKNTPPLTNESRRETAEALGELPPTVEVCNTETGEIISQPTRHDRYTDSDGQVRSRGLDKKLESGWHLATEDDRSKALAKAEQNAKAAAKASK